LSSVMMGPVQIPSNRGPKPTFAAEEQVSNPASSSHIGHTPHLGATAHIPLIEVSPVPAAARVAPGPLHHVRMWVTREVPQEHELAPIAQSVNLLYICNSIVANPAPPVVPPHVPVSEHHPHQICLPVIVRRPSIRMTCCPSHLLHVFSIGCHSKAAISSLSSDMVASLEGPGAHRASTQPSIVTTKIVEPYVVTVSMDPGTEPASIPRVPNAKPIVVGKRTVDCT